MPDSEATSVLEDLTISEGSLVDKGDNPEAHIMLFKSRVKGTGQADQTDDTVDPMEPEGIFTKLKRWVGVHKMDYDLPKTTDQIMAEQDFVSQFMKLRAAFTDSVESILDCAKPEEMPSMLQQTVSEFTTRANALASQVTKDANGQAHLAAILAELGSSLESDTGDNRKRFAKALGDLDEFQPVLAETTTQEGDEMEATEKTFESVMEALSADDREIIEQAMAKAAAQSDDTEEEVTKAEEEVPESVQKAMNDLQKRLAHAEAQVAKAEEDKRTQEYIQKAKAMDPGVDVEALADVLKTADGMSAEFGGKVAEIISALVAQAKAGQDILTKSVGTTAPVDGDSPESKLNNLAKEIQAKGGISFEAAFTKAMKENPDLARQAISA